MKVKVLKNVCCKNIPIGSVLDVIPGMQADAADIYNTPVGMCYLCKDENGTLEYIPATFVEIVDASNTDWQQVRINAAISIIQGFVANPNKYICASREDLVDMSIKTADCLVKKLQEEEKK